MFRLFFLYIISLVSLCASSQTALTSDEFKGIIGTIFDSATRVPLAARIVIINEKNDTINSFYQKLPGFFTNPGGTFKQALDAGKYTMIVFHGIDYSSQKIHFNVRSNDGVKVNVFLKRWFPLKEEGWVNGDGHDHLYTDIKSDSLMLDTVKQICLAQGIDFMCTAQGWAGYNDTTWRSGYSHFNDERFTISYGSEMPKYRTGHTWWLGQSSIHNIFGKTMDTSYENQYYQSEKGTEWTFNTLKFPNIPDVEVVQKIKHLDHAVAVMAHPTSWWWQKRGDIEKYVTNAACYLSFGLLAGKIWDGQVVMGYDHDHYNYQNLWFNVLNQGYRMTALSELDGGYNRNDKFYYGSMRTYYHIDNQFSIDKITDAVRKGRTFVTSGPIIMTDVDGKYQLGDIIPANGTKHAMHIRAYASGEEDDTISYVVVFRNGKIFRLWDVRGKAMKKFESSLQITEKEKAWYIIKVYGKNAWKDPSSLDVMRVVNKKTRRSYDYLEGEVDVAITSPFYFWPKGTKDPAPLISKVDLTVTGDSALINGVIHILINGKEIKEVPLKEGIGSFTMPVNGLIKITADNYIPIFRTLYFDYPPHQALLEELSSGRWMLNYDSTMKFNPGEIPWEQFHFNKTRDVLSDVKWNIEMRPNERDALWESFLSTK